MKDRRTWVLVVALPACAWLGIGASGAAETQAFAFSPGPAVISDAEKEIQPDPNGGAEHGVVLVWESEVDERPEEYSRHSFHIRAKILSNEGRELANVEIPFNTQEGELKQWWGRTIQPDGTVSELRKEDLKEQEIARTRWEKVRVLKGALPGVMPGCVVDYGYTFDKTIPTRLLRWWRLPIQRPWPIREFRYTWKPWAWLARGYSASRTQGLDLKVEGFTGNVNVAGRNLPAVPQEPFMPADNGVRAAASFYYFNKKESHKDFWNTEAKRLAERAAAFSKDRRPLEGAVAAMNLPPDADLDTKLRSAFDWLAANVKNRHLKTSEEKEAAAGEDEKEAKTAKDVLAAREGSSRQLDFLFIGLARALGAEADVVQATDRTEKYWDRGLLTTDQFDFDLVAVRAPGVPENKSTLTDPGSGLPYGDIPWWVAGTNGVLMTPTGAREIMLPASAAKNNLSNTSAEIALKPDGGVAKARWSRSGKGQQGLLERRSLRRSTPEERTQRLEELCGASAELEVTKGESPQLDDPAAGFRLECEAQAADPGEDAGASEVSIRIEGAWIETVPELVAPARVHPVVFDFPREDRATIEVSAPPGFGPKGAPAPVRIEGPFGKYSLLVTATPAGYHVERSFSLQFQNMQPDRYPGIRKYLTDVRRADKTALEFKRAGGAP